MKLYLPFIVVFSFLITFLFPKILQADYNVASVYQLADSNLKDGDIIINSGSSGLNTTDVAYDSRIFGVLVDNPLLVLRESSSSARPVMRAGDVKVKVTDFNGEIKKGDLVTSSIIKGFGMKASQSGYVVGVALENAAYDGPAALAGNKQVKTGSVNVAMRIEYGELSTARNTNRLLEQLNSAFFANVKDPEKFILIIRYVLAGLIGLVAFAIGFFAVTRSMSNAVEAIGRNPLAKSTILMSVGIQIFIALAGALATVFIILIIVRT